jgi:sec-independent protein translocase protein TatA
MLGSIGLSEILVILVLVLVLFFGARRIPDIARALGKTIPSFKKGYSDTDEDSPPQPVKKDK